MRWPLLLIFSVLALGVASPAVAPAQTRVEETALATTVYTGGGVPRHPARPWSGGAAAPSQAALSPGAPDLPGAGGRPAGPRGAPAGAPQGYPSRAAQVERG